MTTTIPSVDLELRVARGAALLDIERPGWHLAINPTTLSLASEDQCILGQLYGNFHTGIDELLPDTDLLNQLPERLDFAMAHGLDNDPSTDTIVFSGHPEYDALTAIWLDAISQRCWSARPGNLTPVPTLGGSK